MINRNTKIIAFVGMAGSGKSTAVDYITEKGFPKVYFGGVILNAITETGLDINAENEQRFREELREREGKDFVVKRIIKQIHDLQDAGQHRIIADGLYSWTEYKALKHEFPCELTVIAVITHKKFRHHRLLTRPIRPLTQVESDQRDWSEIENLEKGGPIAIADYHIVNDEDFENLYSQIDNVLKEIEFTE